MPQLDGLRAFAVLGVFIAHSYFGRVGLLALLDVGSLGVELFFVLSGFLITRILLAVKAGCDSEGARLAAIGRFYARRILRIFPVYYVTLSVLVLLRNPQILQALSWHLSYTSNVYFAFVRRGHLDILGAHFWTLSVEEQFYLFWPWLIVFLPSRFLTPTVIGAVCIACLFRVAALLGGWTTAWLLLPATLDQFGVGALLALYEREAAKVPRTAIALALGVTVLYSVVSLLLPPFFGAIRPLVLAVGFVAVVAAAAHRQNGIFGRLLELPPLLFLGKISYALYVYHPFCAWLVSFVFRHTGRSAEKHAIVHFFLFSCLTIAAAASSWVCFEGPISRLKQHLNLSRDAEAFPRQPAPQTAALIATESIGGRHFPTKEAF